MKSRWIRQPRFVCWNFTQPDSRTIQIRGEGGPNCTTARDDGEDVAVALGRASPNWRSRIFSGQVGRHSLDCHFLLIQFSNKLVQMLEDKLLHALDVFVAVSANLLTSHGSPHASARSRALSLTGLPSRSCLQKRDWNPKSSALMTTFCSGPARFRYLSATSLA